MIKIITIFFLSPLFLFSQKQSADISQYKQMLEEALNSEGSTQHGDSDVRIERISGTVKVSNSYEKEVSLPNNYQYPLESGDTVKTASDGAAYIYINNGGIIRVGRNTEIELSDASDDVAISLSAGPIVSKIERLKDKMTFKITTPEAVCNAKGSEFAVEHTKFRNETVAGVFDDGELDIYPGQEQNDNSVLKVSKNMEVSLNTDSKRQRVVRMDKLSVYKRYISDDKKKLLAYKKKWKRFTSLEKQKYRDALFNKKPVHKNKKIKKKNMEE